MFGVVPKSYRRHAVTLPELLSGFDKEAEKKANSVPIRIPGDEIGAWGRRYFDLTGVLYFDENLNVSDVEVTYIPWQSQRTPFAWFIAKRPNLHDPVGMPLEEARGLMEGAGFRCTPVAFDKYEKSGRPYLACRAVAETLLGGSIVRVRLFYDDAGMVTDTRVQKEGEILDEIVCMLPDRDESFGHAVFKTLIFPARLYAAIVVAGLEADLAMGRP
jgi:hypothetical protein